MPAIHAASPPHRRRDEALTATEAARVSRLSVRLLGELHRVCRSIPPEQRGGSALSRLLGVDRSTCQRLIATVESGGEGAEALLSLPGPEACLAFVEACGRIDAAREGLEGAVAACEEYRAIVRELGRSKAGLARRLRSSQRGSPGHAAARGPLSPIEHARARERHFAASAEIAGRWSDLHSYVWCYRPAPDSPRRVQQISGSMLVGHESRIEALPLMLGSGFGKGNEGGQRLFTGLTGTPIGEYANHLLLHEFSTSPLPSITARQRADMVEYILSTDQTARGKPTDIALAHRAIISLAHPADDDPPIIEVWYMSSYPARQLVMDVYLHRELARECLPSASTHSLSTHFVTVDNRSTTELPHRPPLRILPRGPADADSIHAPRQSEFVRSLLDGAGWSADDLVGYRIEIDYPVWRVGHVIAFRFERR